MDNLKDRLNNLQSEYRKVFIEWALFFDGKVQELKPSDFKGDIFAVYEENSKGFLWQKKVLGLIDECIKNEIAGMTAKIKSMRSAFTCKGCGSCCKMACSEFSPEELKQKARNGDKFAGEFTGIFIPYESDSEIKNIFPQYLELLKNNTEGRYYFYHCPKVTADNKCPDYENRPQICRDFPDNPVAFLPPLCGFNDWKKQSEPVALKLQAMSEILHFYRTNIQDALQRSNRKH